jgi:hypothetical protein
MHCRLPVAGRKGDPRTHGCGAFQLLDQITVVRIARCDTLQARRLNTRNAGEHVVTIRNVQTQSHRCTRTGMARGANWSEDIVLSGPANGLDESFGGLLRALV